MGFDFKKIKQQFKEKESRNNNKGFSLSPTKKDVSSGDDFSAKDDNSLASKEKGEEKFTYSCDKYNIKNLPLKALTDAVKEKLDNETNFDQLEDSVRYLKTLSKIENKSSLNFVKAMEKYLSNIMNEPLENRYRFLKVENKVVQAHILSLPAGTTILNLVGFNLTEDEAYYEFDEKHFDSLSEFITIIQKTEGVNWKIDRNIQILDSIDPISKSNGKDSEDSDLEEKSQISSTSYIKNYIETSQQRKIFQYYGREVPKIPRNTKIIFKFNQLNKTKFMVAHFETGERLLDLIDEIKKNISAASDPKILYCGKNLLDSPLNTTLTELKLYPRVLLDVKL